MKAINFIILTFLICSNSLGQTKKIFDINETLIKDSTQFKTVQNFKKQDSAFYEDENYVVRKSCSGEWGGTIWFKNKNTGIEYSCEATCPVVVNKTEGKYIVTSTLAHMSGFSTVIEINTPDSLAIFKLPEPRNKKGKTKLYYIGDNESNSKKGTKQLVDTMGVLILATFNYKGELFHIVTDFEKTFVEKIENKKFVIIDTISNQSIWTYDPEVIKTSDNHSIVFFKNDEVNGFLDIFDNKINLIRYK